MNIMSVEPSDFLDASKRIIENNIEICFRNAASRAYYAAFHSCKTIAPETPYGGATHQKVIDDLIEDPAFRALGYMLKQCKAIRTRADYKLDDDFLKRDADLCISQSEKIMSRCSDLAS